MPLGVCECPLGTETFRGVCMPARRPLGTGCYSSANCHKFGYCDNGYCVCKAGYVAVNSFCLPPARPIVDDPRAFIDPDKKAQQNREDGPNLPTRFSKLPSASPSMQLGGIPPQPHLFPGTGGWNIENSLPQAVATQMPPMGVGQNGMMGGAQNGLMGAQRFMMGGQGGIMGAQSAMMGGGFLDPFYQRVAATSGGNYFTGATPPTIVAPSTTNTFTPHWYAIGTGGGNSGGMPQSVYGGSGGFGGTDGGNGGYEVPPGGGTEFATNYATQSGGMPPQPPFMPYARGATMANIDGGGLTQNGGTVARIKPYANGGTQSFVTVAMPGEHCGTDRVCLGNARCVFGWCQCPEGTRIENGICSYEKAVASKQWAPPRTRGTHGKQTAPKVRRSDVATPAREFAQPFQNCGGGEQCTQGSECIHVDGLGHVCQCEADRVYFIKTCILKRTNVEVIPVGKTCTLAQICDNGAHCETGVCQCVDGMTGVAGYCVHQSKPGESCADGEFCAGNAVCADTIHTCVCPVGMQVRDGRCEVETEARTVQPRSNDNAAQLQRIAAPGDFCDATTACTNGSYCSALGVCHCSEGYATVYGKCVDANRVRAPGEPCSAADICSAGSWCNGGMCLCLNKKVPTKGSCVEKGLKNPQDTQRRSSAARQVAAQQHPGKDYEEEPDEIAAKSDFMSSEDPSNGPAPFRSPSLAAQQLAASPRSSLQQHIRIFKLHMTCKLDEDCHPGSNCRYSRCYCNDLPIRNRTSDGHGAAGVQRGTTQRCEIDADCLHPLECRENRCICAAQSSKTSKKGAGSDLDRRLGIRPGAPERPRTLTTSTVVPGMFCDEFSACGEGAECLEGRCRCVDPTQLLTYDEGKTVCVASPEPTERTPKSFQITGEPQREPDGLQAGKKCRFSYECQAPLTCFKGFCTCLESSGGGDRDACKPRKLDRRALEDLRLRDAVLTDTNTSKSDNQMTSAPPGGSCARGEQCTGGSFCRAGWCSCPETDMVISKGECVKQQKPQQPQQNSYASPAAYPSQQQYATYNAATAAPQRVMYTAPPATQAPQPRRAVPGTSCGPLDICMGGSQCIDGICLCPAGTQPNRLTAVCEPMVATQVPSAPEATTVASQLGNRPGLAWTPSTMLAITSAPFPATPLTPPMVPPLSALVEDECAKRGLFCHGGTICVDLTCQCPPNTVLLNDQCQPMSQFGTVLRASKNRRELTGPASRYARPSSPCSSGEICTGGSVCVDKRICTCPPHKPIIRDYICSSPDETTPTPKFAAPGQTCDASTLCTEQSVCYNGKCRCPSGYIAIGGKCARLPPMKSPHAAQTTAAAAAATQKDAQPGVVQRSCPGEEVIHNGRCVHPAALQRTPAPSTIAPPIPADSPHRTAKSVPPTAGQRTHHASPGKPVISGPPLRRPKPAGSVTVSTYGSGTTVLTGDGPGVCPPGNYPLIEEDGRIRICSGMEPHCPPKSYCYVTGVASANYNCCSVP